MPKTVTRSTTKKRKASKKKKHKDLAVLAETRRLKRFFPARLKQQR